MSAVLDVASPDRLLQTAIANTVSALRRDGWCIVKSALPRETIAALDGNLATAFAETPFCQGGFYGETTKRFGRLLTRSAFVSRLVQHSLILGTVRQLLDPWCDTIQLNVTQAIAVHPGAPAQLPHRDQDMWRGPVGEIEYLVNVIWPLTPFRADNGATVMWTGSHGAHAVDPDDTAPGVAAAMDPGDALMFLGSTRHGAGANRSGDVRRGLVVGYSLGWLKPYENLWLAYPPEVARNFSPELAALAGYTQHRPNLGNYEGQCPSILLGERDDRPLAATDALRPDQEVLIAAFVASQRAV